jgi:hypothetical protein
VKTKVPGLCQRFAPYTCCFRRQLQHGSTVSYVVSQDMLRKALEASCQDAGVAVDYEDTPCCDSFDIAMGHRDPQPQGPHATQDELQRALEDGC